MTDEVKEIKLDLKLSKPELEILEMCFVALNQAQDTVARYNAAVAAYLTGLAQAKGIDPDTHRFNTLTQSFELKPTETTGTT